MLDVLLSGVVGGVLGAVLGGRIQAQAVRVQTDRDLEARRLAALADAEAARLDRLEAGVASLRATSLGIRARIEFSFTSGESTRAAAQDLLAGLEARHDRLVEASTLIQVNGDVEIAAEADRLLQACDDLFTWSNQQAGRLRRNVQFPQAHKDLADCAIQLERMMRQRRGLPLLDRGDPAED